MELRFRLFQRVVVPKPVSARCYQARAPQIRQVARRGRLGNFQHFHQVPDAHFSVEKQMQDAQARWVRERAKHEIDLGLWHRRSLSRTIVTGMFTQRKAFLPLLSHLHHWSASLRAWLRLHPAFQRKDGLRTEFDEPPVEELTVDAVTRGTPEDVPDDLIVWSSCLRLLLKMFPRWASDTPRIWIRVGEVLLERPPKRLYGWALVVRRVVPFECQPLRLWDRPRLSLDDGNDSRRQRRHAAHFKGWPFRVISDNSFRS